MSSIQIYRYNGLYRYSHTKLMAFTLYLWGWLVLKQTLAENSIGLGPKASKFNLQELWGRFRTAAVVLVKPPYIDTGWCINIEDTLSIEHRGSCIDTGLRYNDTGSCINTGRCIDIGWCINTGHLYRYSRGAVPVQSAISIELAVSI